MPGNTPCMFGLALLLAVAPSSAADPSWYLHRKTWQETLRASREALRIDAAERAAAAGRSVPPRLGPWYSIGPISVPAKHDLSKLLAPARELDPDRAYALGGQGGALRWMLRLGYADGWVHTLHTGPHVVYLYRTITAAAPTRFPVYLDAVGEMAAWLNGDPVMTRRRGRIRQNVWGPDIQVQATAIDVPLRAGRNDLLIAITLQPRPRPADDGNPWRKFTEQARRPWGTVFTGDATESGPAAGYERLVYGQVSRFYFSTDATLGPTVHPRASEHEQLWKLVRRDFADAAAMRRMEWERKDGIWRLDWAPDDLCGLAGRYAGAMRNPVLRTEARSLARDITDPAGLARVRELYYRDRSMDAGERCLHNTAYRRGLSHKLTSLRLAIRDLIDSHPDKYPNGPAYLARLDAIKKSAKVAGATEDARLYAEVCAKLEALRYEALLANPLLDFQRLLLVKRRANPFVPDLPMNWASNSSIAKTGYDNEIAVLSPVGPRGALTTLYRPEGERFVGDVDLHFEGERMLFSMPGSNDRWQVFEVRTDGTGLRQVTRGDADDVDSYDPCYLPSEKILFCSTACFAGVPCVRGRDHVAVLYGMDPDGRNVRQLCFEQDHDWCPTMLADGRVLYTRWEYTDTPHFFARLLFSMNPDGTGQTEYYGSNSYWPNAIFYARPIPGHATKVVGIVSGHHAARRSGELVIFDPAQGRHEADGVVQRIPGRGQHVDPVINDRLVVGSWPKFLHPFPLNEKYFLVSCRMNEGSRWGIYLVDVFDNMLLLREEADYDLLEPIPLRKRRRPPVIPERVDLKRTDAVVTLSDVYAGPGLKGVPRGTVKRLRLIAYHYAYQGMADDSRAIGVDASWDTVKMVLGTVPVCEDGSAMFRVPANTPISIQPLDARGKAVQLMRSWMTAMPGETVSCVGCHESPNTAPPMWRTQAAMRGPSSIRPWYGPVRGFSFKREVQPVLDQYCVGCHHGKHPPDFRARAGTDPRGFSPSYLQLHPFVRRPGAEADYHLLPAGEYYADTSELVQLLERGHHNVKLDAEAWDRLITWIDLNVPFHGTWHEAQGEKRVGNQRQRRRTLRLQYAGIDIDPEAVPELQRAPIAPVLPDPLPVPNVQPPPCPGWPFDAAEAQRRQHAAGPAVSRSIDLGDGVTMALVRIPAGEFLMGDAAGQVDERPVTRVRIARPFWMGKCEVTNRQYAAFDASHDSRYIRTHGITSTRGYPVNLPAQPVVRISWQQAMAFCRWLSEKTGETFSIPTEAQWEYACRAGTSTPLSYGNTDTDFSEAANLADTNVAHLRDYSHNSKLAWMPRDARFDDHAMVTAAVGRYRANAWALHDMHGNATEWTRTTYRPYPYRTDDGRDDASETGRKVVRGGSWRDRPQRARSAFRLSYPSWMGVYNVGFRVVAAVTAKPAP